MLEGIESALNDTKSGNLAEDTEASWSKTISKFGYEKTSLSCYAIGLSYPQDWDKRNVSFCKGDKTVLEQNITFHGLTIVVWKSQKVLSLLKQAQKL